MTSAGCTDLDLSVSPYPNTLALRRLKLRPGQSSELLAALTRRVVWQRRPDGGQRFFVRKYPGQFSLIDWCFEKRREALSLRSRRPAPGR